MLRRTARRWHRWLKRRMIGRFDWGDLRRLEPVDSHFGAGRGSPVDRYYIENFLRQHCEDIRGAVLETGHREYSRAFGRNVTRSELLHAIAGNPHATILGDIASSDLLPRESFDCIILTQTLQYVFAPQDALRSCHQALKPGGVLLLSVPVISQCSRMDQKATGEYWRFTAASVRRLLDPQFGSVNVLVEGHGNLLAAVAFLTGIAAEELSVGELDHCDPEYELVVVARAVKSR